MKKVYMYLLAMCCGLGALAQTEQGNWLVGGNFTLNTASNNTTIGLNPTAGYFVMNNLAVGGTINLGYAQFGENKSTAFGIGPLVRYYFGQRNVRPFLNGEFAFQSIKFKSPTETNTENGVNILLGLGLAGFLNPNVALEAIAGYNHTRLEGDGDGGFVLRVGFQVYLRPRDAVNQIRSGQ
jgi:hypothetical protein